MKNDIDKTQQQKLIRNLIGKVFYVHSDNEEYHVLYCKGKLISWTKNATEIPVILRGLGISYYDYQISDNVCVPDFNSSYWNPPESLYSLHFIDKAERRAEYRQQKNAGKNVSAKDFEKLKFIRV